MACANEQEYERRPQDRSPLCRRCSAGSETFCPQVDEAPHVLAGPRHAAPPATCEPLVGSRSLLLHRPWNLSARKFASQPSRICMQRFVCGMSWNKQPTWPVTDASCKLRHKRTRDHARRRPHRTLCHPLVIHLAPIDSMLCCGPAAQAVRHPEPYETPPGDDRSIAIALAAFRWVPRPRHGQHAIVSPWHHVQ